MLIKCKNTGERGYPLIINTYVLYTQAKNEHSFSGIASSIESHNKKDSIYQESRHKQIFLKLC